MSLRPDRWRRLTPCDQGCLENIAADLVAQHHHQLHVEVDSLCSHGGECDEEEVVEEDSKHGAEGWHSCSMDG